MANELSMDEAFIKKLNRILEVNLENEQFGVEELAHAMGLSRSQLFRKLNSITGKSISQYIREYRLERAMEMLQNKIATASEIAFRVGFGSPTYFNTSFHQYYGYPPGEVKLRKSLSFKDIKEAPPLNETTNATTIKRRSSKFRTYIIGALALISIVALGYYNYANSDKANFKEIENPISITENSIAVLPFKNMSRSPDDEAFCDGMTTAIISRLSKIKGIKKVISQTSMMNYKENTKAMTLIADELNVNYILESSFQKSGNEIKINLQLIEGTSDKLIWSDEYEGKYDSIFKIQARVAEMVAKQLDANVTDEERIEIQNAMTSNPEAYENYLMGEQVISLWTTNAVIASRRFYEKAIALDSTFAEPYFKIAQIYMFLGIWNGTMPKTEANKLARPYLEKALQLDPNNVRFLSFIASSAHLDWNFKKADSIYKKLYDLGYEHNGDIFYFLQGNSDRVIDYYFTILGNPLKDESDPNFSREYLVYALYNRGEIDEAKHVMEISFPLLPNSDAHYDHFGNGCLAMGDYEKAKDILETRMFISGKRIASMVAHLAAAYHYLGDEGKSLELINEVIDRANKGEPEINVFVAHYYARLGKNDEAFKWLDIAYKKHEVDLIWLKADPNLLLLKDDPRYKRLLKKIGFLEI